MTDFLKYQCTECRRVRAIPKDNIRAVPNHCTITKGCKGSLNIIGQSANVFSAAPDARLTDWYPRGKISSITNEAATDEYIDLSGYDSGALTLAINVTDPGAVTSASVTFLQRKIQSVSFTQFIFRLTAGENSVSGRDTQGKNLRIDSSAIAESRVKVRVNGVETPNFTISTDGRTILLNESYPTFSTVDVFVFSEKDVVAVTMDFTPNRLVNTAANRGAWGNVAWIEMFNNDSGQYERFYVFTVSNVVGVSSLAKLKLESVIINGDIVNNSKIAFLLATPPFSHYDRNTTNIVKASDLSDFVFMSSSDTPRKLSVKKTAVFDVYPPIRIRRGTETSLSFDDITPESVANTEYDTSTNTITNKFINGPA